MTRNSILFLQFIVVLIGMGTLVFMLYEPHLEGRNANATLVEIYFKDPFLAFAYLASVSYFMILFKSFKLLGYIGKGNAFSLESLKSIKVARSCALILLGFVVLGEIFIILNESDDRAGGVVMGILIAAGSVIFFALVTVLEQILQKGLDIKTNLNIGQRNI